MDRMGAVEITFDPAKNDRNIRERGLSFERAMDFDFASARMNTILGLSLSAVAAFCADVTNRTEHNAKEASDLCTAAGLVNIAMGNFRSLVQSLLTSSRIR